MKSKYETPELEITKFNLATNVLTASVTTTDRPETSGPDIVIPGGGEGNPFG